MSNSKWAIEAAKKILTHLDVEDFPSPIAKIIESAFGQLIRCGNCEGWFPYSELQPASAHPEADAICNRCLDQEDWRKGVALVYSAIGEPDPPGLCCATLAEKVLAIRAENERRAAELLQLRKILAFVPARIAIEAKERAGYPNIIRTMGDL